MLLFTAGCSSPQKDILVDTASTAAQSDILVKQSTIEIKKPNMTNPRIVLWIRRSGLEATQYEVMGDSVKIGGPIEYIDIIFEKRGRKQFFKVYNFGWL